MKKTITQIIVFLLLLNTANAQSVDHTFNYQGELLDNNVAAAGTYNFTVQAFSDLQGTVPIGTLAEYSGVNAVLVTQGLFNLDNVDLGIATYDGLNIWLQISVKKPTDTVYTPLSPLQKIQSVPYATTLIDKGATNGQVLTFNTTSGWQPANSSGAIKIDDLTDAKSDSDGTNNGSSIFIGVGAGALDDSSDNKNVGVGDRSLNSNTSGSDNTAIGSFSLFSNTTGLNNTASGEVSLFSNTTGMNNTASGLASLFSNTTASSNTASGYFSLYSNTIGSYNTATGNKSLYFNTSGDNNTANGSFSLYSNTTGSENTANGYFSLYSNTTGINNTVNGGFSQYFNTSGSNNTSTGYKSLYSNTTGFKNTAIGNFALFLNVDGYQNNANGNESLYSNTSGYDNTATGFKSLYSNTSGYYNTANGSNSLFNNTTGLSNSAFGDYSLYSNTIGYSNSAMGDAALFNNTTGYLNNAIGRDSLGSNTSGLKNNAMGYRALYYNITGSNNTALGNSASSNQITDLNNTTGLGFGAGPTTSNTIRIGNASITTIGGFANWTNVSDARFKTHIREDVPGLEFIKKLRPVTYQLNMEAIAKFYKTPKKLRLAKSESLKAAEIQTGFLAQEVEAAAQSLGYDFHGVDKPKNKNSHYGLRYAEFVVPLVKAVQELADANNRTDPQIQNYEVTTLQLQRQIETLKSENKRQRAINQQLINRLDDIEKLLTE